MNLFLTKYRRLILGFVILVSLILHFSVFEKELVGVHAWRQTQTQNNIDNFYAEDMNILNPRMNPRREYNGIMRQEFPLFQWMVAASYKLTGQSVMITRIICFLVSIFGIAGFYKLTKLLFKDAKAGLTGAWTFTFSPVFFYYSVNPLPDLLSLCTVIPGIFFSLKFREKDRTSDLLAAFFFISVSALSKLPFVLFFALPAGFLLQSIINRSKNIFFLFIPAIFFTPVLVWYISVIPAWKENGVITGLFSGKDSLSYILSLLSGNLVSTLPELLLNYAAVPAFVAGLIFAIKKSTSKKNLWLLITSILVILYFLFEINMIGTVHDYYLFPFLPLLFILVTKGFMLMAGSERKFISIFALICLLALPFTAWARIHHRWHEDKPGFNPDLVKYKSALRKAVPSNEKVLAGSDLSTHIFFYYIGKKGWSFEKDNYSEEILKDAYSKGVRYVYSDWPEIEKGSFFRSKLSFTDSAFGSIRVYHLK